SFEQSKVGPASNVEPLRVTSANHRATRFHGDDFGQDDVIIRIGELGTLCSQSRRVSSVDDATAIVLGPHNSEQVHEHDGVEFHAVGGKVVSSVQLCGGGGFDTDSSAAQIESGFNAIGLAYHEALTIIEHGADKADAQLSVTAHGPGGGAGENVNFTCGQSGEAFLA